MRTYSFLTTSEFFSHKISLSKSLVLFVIMLALSIKTGAVNNMIYYKLDGTVLHLSGTNKSGYSSSHTGNTVPNWRDACKDVVTEVIFDDKIQPDRITLWFCLFSKLEKITNMSNLDTSETTYTASVFNGCSSLKSIDLSNFETKKMTSMMAIYGFADDYTKGVSAGTFVKVKAGASIAPFRAYLEVTGTAGARLEYSISFDDEATGIRSVKADDNGSWYSIDGRRLSGQPSAKGVYIKNGKKTIIK